MTFNEDGTSSLSISSVDYTDTTLSTGLNLSDLTEATSGTSTIALTDAAITASTALTAGSLLSADAEFTAGDTLTFTDANGTELATLDVTATTTVADLEAVIDGIDGASAALSSGVLTTTSDFRLSVSSSNAGFNSGATLTTNGTDSSFATDSSIDSTLSALKSAQDTLRAQASTFGTNLSIVEGRQDFTNALINTLEEGAGKLTLADTNEEGANLLALQTQQTLASTSLSLAAQADQNVLRLF